jgi:hypothetical protein
LIELKIRCRFESSAEAGVEGRESDGEAITISREPRGVVVSAEFAEERSIFKAADGGGGGDMIPAIGCIAFEE